MKHTNISLSRIRERIMPFFSVNKSLSDTITKWVAGNTVNASVKNSPFIPLTGIDVEDNFAPANE